MRLNLQNESGMSLLSVVVALGMMGVLAAGTTKVLTSAFQANKRSSNTIDLNAFKRTIVDRLDCAQSVPTVQNTCAAGDTYSLKDKSGNDLFTPTGGTTTEYEAGNWLIKANCDTATGGLIIAAESKKPDPLTKQIISKTNIFGTGAKLCETRFDIGGGGGGGGGAPGTTGGSSIAHFVAKCGTGTYNLPTASDTCCRMVTHKKAAGDGQPTFHGNNTLAIAMCTNSEYMAWGGGRCQDDDSAASDAQLTFANEGADVGTLIHTSQPYFGPDIK